MKIAYLLFPAVFSAIMASAVSPPSGAISQTPSSTPSASNPTTGAAAITNRTGQAISSDEIQNQLSELRRVIEETTPVLSSVAQSYSNSTAAAKPTVVGGIANVLGGLLNRNTNSASGQAATGSTNALGRILQGVVGAATTNATPASSAELRDLVSLQEHLQATLPILQRLGVSTNMAAPSALGGTQDESDTETGQDRGSKNKDND